MLACALKAVYGVLFLVEPTLSFLIATHEFGVSADTNKAFNPEKNIALHRLFADEQKLGS
jgi:hypothetical protein